MLSTNPFILSPPPHEVDAIVLPHFIDEASEAQRGSVTCPRPPSEQVRGSRTQALQCGSRACTQPTYCYYYLLLLLLLSSDPDQSHSVVGRHSRLPLNGGICGQPCPEQTLGLRENWPWPSLPCPHTAQQACWPFPFPTLPSSLSLVWG